MCYPKLYPLSFVLRFAPKFGDATDYHTVKSRTTEQTRNVHAAHVLRSVDVSLVFLANKDTHILLHT